MAVDVNGGSRKLGRELGRTHPDGQDRQPWHRGRPGNGRAAGKAAAGNLRMVAGLVALGTAVHAGLTGLLAMSCNATAIMRFTLARLS